MAEQLASYKAALTATTGTTGGGALSLANPEGRDLIVTRLIIDITTPSTGAANISAGIAANGTTSSANLIDTQSAATSAKVLDNLNDAGTAGKSKQKWTSGQFLTVTASATLAGMVANAYIYYTRL